VGKGKLPDDLSKHFDILTDEEKQKVISSLAHTVDSMCQPTPQPDPRVNKVNPHIVLDPTAVIVVMPFDVDAKEELKRQVPFEQRTWDPKSKCWKLSLTKENYTKAFKILSDHFEMFRRKPLVFNKGGDVQATFDAAIDNTSHYTILKIEEDATKEEVKKAYRKLAIKIHPDRNPDDKRAADLFILVQKAYTTLHDVKKRKRYDMARRLIYKEKPDPFSISQSPFGHQQAYQPPPRTVPNRPSGRGVFLTVGGQEGIFVIDYHDVVNDTFELIDIFDGTPQTISVQFFNQNTQTIVPPINPNRFKRGEIVIHNGMYAKVADIGLTGYKAHGFIRIVYSATGSCAYVNSSDCILDHFRSSGLGTFQVGDIVDFVGTTIGVLRINNPYTIVKQTSPGIYKIEPRNTFRGTPTIVVMEGDLRLIGAAPIGSSPIPQKTVKSTPSIALRGQPQRATRARSAAKASQQKQIDTMIQSLGVLPKSNLKSKPSGKWKIGDPAYYNGEMVIVSAIDSLTGLPIITLLDGSTIDVPEKFLTRI